jgi:hypothetical protein
LKILQRLKDLFSLLQSYEGSWAICGGVAASIYRTTPRFTGDIDIAIIDHNGQSAKEISQSVLTSLGYNPILGFVTDEHGKLIKPQALVIGREVEPGTFVGVDFLLPVMPWIESAVFRAQKNKLDYGFARIPTITVEDLCVAKLWALRGPNPRSVDLEDVLAVLEAAKEVDSNYILQSCANLSIVPPDEVQKLL